jgi:mannose-1-phosphate guanylyltransferase
MTKTDVARCVNGEKDLLFGLSGSFAMPRMTKNRPMPAILFAAGCGTRLRPLTDRMPKCLAPIHGRPLLSYWLALLSKAGLFPIILNTHHRAEQVREYADSCPWKDRIQLAHETELLGTGGTLLRHRTILREGPFMAIHADNLSIFDVQAFQAAHAERPEGCCLTMMLFRSPTPESCGIVRVDGNGIVREFHEKAVRPPGNLANAAVYIMEPEVFPMLAGSGKKRPDISLDLLPRCLGRIATWRNDRYHRDIGTPESYAAALREFPPPKEGNNP